MIGIVFALLSSIFFGLYIIPRKLSKLSPVNFGILMALSYTLGSLFVYLGTVAFYNPEPLFNEILLFSILAGVLWAIALIFFVNSIDLIGISRSNQWKNLQGPIGVLLALVILGEFTSVNPVLAMMAGLFIFLSAVTLNIRKSQDVVTNNKGLISAVISGVLFGIVSLLNKIVTNGGGIFSQQVVWSSSILISLVSYKLLIIKQSLRDLFVLPFREKVIGTSSGILYFGASLFMLLAFKFLESSIAFNIIQLNFLIALTLGIFYFKEINFKKYYLRIILGLLFALFGIYLLSLSRF
jgi:glucose uptake protein